MRRILPLVLLLAFATPASSQTIDGQGADDLALSLSRYFGVTAFQKGVVKVAADGDAYRLEFDFAALARLFPQQDVIKVGFDPLVLRLKPGVGTTWDVAGALFPNGSLEFTTSQGPRKMQWNIVDGAFTGVYDTALAAFTMASGSHKALSTVSEDANQHAEVRIGSGTIRTEASRAANGGVDISVTQIMSDFSETIRAEIPNGGGSLSVATGSPTVAVTSTGTGVRTQAFLDLLAFAVANADEARIKANQAELKTRVLAVLPLWEKIDGRYDVDGVSIESPIGMFSTGKVEVAASGDGISRNGALNYGFRVADLQMPTQVLPAWTVPLLPTDVDFNFGGVNLDSESAVRAAIEAFDLNRDPPIPDSVGVEIGKKFLAANPKFVIGRSFIKNKDSEIAFDGEFTYAGEKPAFKATIDAAGYDRIVEVLQTAAATEPDAQQVFPLALAAKGLAKVQPDGSLKWVVDVRPDGSILVNGGMIKPAN